jgi:hypothetical protein
VVKSEGLGGKRELNMCGGNTGNCIQYFVNWVLFTVMCMLCEGNTGNCIQYFVNWVLFTVLCMLCGE